MHMAALNNHLHIIQYLVETWHVSTIEKRDDGWTCLHIAAAQGNALMVTYLLKHKAEVDVCTAQGDTALHLAAQNNHIAVIEQLVILGQANVELTDRDERTPLYVAARQGHLATVQYLVEHGSVIDRTNDIGWTPLIMACRNNHLGAFVFLSVFPLPVFSLPVIPFPSCVPPSCRLHCTVITTSQYHLHFLTTPLSLTITLLPHLTLSTTPYLCSGRILSDRPRG